MNNLGIVILNWNGQRDTIECIKSIRENEEILYPIFLLDNGSKSDSVKYIEDWLKNDYKSSFEILDLDQFNFLNNYSQANLFLIKSKVNLGFAKGNNVVWKKIKDTFNYVFLLNNDTVIEKNSISRMINYMNSHSDVGVVSCDIRLYSYKEKLWHAGGYFTWYGNKRYFKQSVIDNHKRQGVKAISTPFVTGCAMMVRKSVSNRIGLFTENFFHGEEDFNYCKRLSIADIKVDSVLESTIYHKVGTSIKKTQKLYNSYILHYSNRIIDQKNFIHLSMWKLWRKIYIFIIILKIYKNIKDIGITIKVIRNIRYYTKKYEEINYETFLEIGNII
ncbi:MAG: glycosyltransferase [Candidatus Izemoplasmataceae bacterium]